MADEININKMISGSTSNVSVSDLSRQGFKKVKVLNQEMIKKLIVKSVDKVLQAREADISEKTRQQVIEKSKKKFQELLQNKVEEVKEEKKKRDIEFQDQAGRLQTVVDERDRLKKELEEKCAACAERDHEIEALKKQSEAQAREIERIQQETRASETGASEKLKDVQDELEKEKKAREEEARRLEESRKEFEDAKARGAEQAEALKRAEEALENEKKARGEQDEKFRQYREKKEADSDRIAEEIAGLKQKIQGDANAEKGPGIMEMMEMFRVMLKEVRQNEAASKQETVGEMRESMEFLADRIAQGIARSGGGGGGGGSVQFRNDESATDVAAALLGLSSDVKIESNIGKVSVKKGKAKQGVGSSLNKLKAMQGKGGE